MIHDREYPNMNCITGSLRNCFSMHNISITEEEIFVEGGGALTVYGKKNKIESNTYDAAMSFLTRNNINIIYSEEENESIQYEWLINNISNAYIIGHIDVRYLTYSKLFENTKNAKFHFINILKITEKEMYIYDGHIPGKIVSTYEGRLNIRDAKIYKTKFIGIPYSELTKFCVNHKKYTRRATRNSCPACGLRCAQVKYKFFKEVIQQEICSKNKNIGNGAFDSWLEDIKDILLFPEKYQNLCDVLFAIASDLVTEGVIGSRILLKKYIVNFFANEEWIQGIDVSLDLLNQLKLIFIKASFTLKQKDIENALNTIHGLTEHEKELFHIINKTLLNDM